MNFSIEQLQSFVAVYEHGSFSKAAQSLDKHRTTVGQVVSNLEDELAVELFERMGRTAQPTEDAVLLYRYAKLVIEQARSFDKIALSLSFGELESITVAYNSFIPPGALSCVRQKLLELHPSMKVNFIVRNREEIREGIQDDSIHFGIVNIDDRKLVTSIESTLVNNVTFGVYVSKDNDMLQLPLEQRWHALKSQKQIVLKGLLDDQMDDKIIISSDYEIVDQITLGIQLVEDNVGWTLLPRLVTYTDFHQHNLVELEISTVRENFKVPMAVWSPHAKHLRSLHSEIVGSLISYVERVNREAGSKY
ncbi:LysR family transcriptional regulator [Vibrio methylphosphonaticus]|uniref:LysR family transcriptional regulator n=1 Tax=Vibrio methylphosphonaticus TaxID=2946866 RepID=UPI00202A863A|nr:LysR family transcriptional regulator [Vibrio methylphosphonaticus]MCL9773922.1 LysR family transcriptional regulator [Vibrio methylphosphonaticus]